MNRIVLIDGNSILNRAFYGIMGSKMLMTADGTYTNAVYGFLNIMFKIMDDLNPEYMMITFDLKAPTERHKLYEGYKATRKGMPNELAGQLPIIKGILRAMNIKIIEKEGYEGDDVLGTVAKIAEKDGLKVTILSGDRDTFQLATDNVTIRIPRTKMGKTETEDFDREKVLELYGIEPKQLIDVKGLQGDTSDNIPGVPGIGEKTALSLIKKYGSIEKLYDRVEKDEAELKGKQKENIENNKELAYLSKKLGTINLSVPIEDDLESMRVTSWDNDKVLEIFKELKFNRFIERFNLINENNIQEDKEEKELFTIEEIDKIENILENITKEEKLFYYLSKKDINNENIIKKDIISINIYNREKNIIYYIKDINGNLEKLKEIFENEKIEKYGYDVREDYIILKDLGINIKNIKYDAKIAAYILNPTESKYILENLADQYLKLDIREYLEKKDLKLHEDNTQINLFDSAENNSDNEYLKYESAIYLFTIEKLYDVTINELKQKNELDLFNNIEMPLVEVLADMQYTGMYVDKDELVNYGKNLKEKLDVLKDDIHEMAGEDFNINSTKQLGEILFDKLKLPVYKKTKNGYSTDVDVLEKLKKEHPIIEKILDYRQLMKLNSTYVEGLIQYINSNTKRIHSSFHQTVTATGRISSTDPNLQNIPTRIELGKKLRKVFKPGEGKVFIDADYSQIELRVLSHISDDEHMIEAFKNNEDIHKQAASRVFNIPLEQVTKEERSKAKAVNFGIVYGISDFGLGEQIGVSRKKAKEYIEQYLDKYSGIREFMNSIVEKAKEQGYVETLFNRRRYIPEIKSNNYMVRQFGNRVAMNTPIQGTAADIMKIAMINVYNELKNNNMKTKIILQVHDELILESPLEELEKSKEILKNCMENATKLKVPLIVDVSEADNWYNAK